MQDYISTANYSGLTNWSVKALIKNSFGYNKKYDLFCIRDFLQRNKNTISIDDTVTYTRVTIKLYNKGVFKRDEVQGVKIGTKKQYLIKAGQFIISKIDARNGAFGIVPDFLEGAVTTSDFLSYDINIQKINPDFLRFLTTTKQFLKYCQNASSGTTGRQRINEKTFLDAKIPLPPLKEQNRIVKSYNRNIQLAEQQEQKAIQIEKNIDEYLFDVLDIKKLDVKEKQILKIVNYSDLDRWDNTKEFILKSKFPITKVKNIISDISTGTTPPTTRDEYFKNGDINFYTPADLTNKMYLTESKRKVTKLAFEDRKSRKFIKDTLFFVGIGSTIGKVSIVFDEFATSNQQITGLYFDKSKVNIEYIYYFFNQFSNITTVEKTQATIPIINQVKILNIPIPLPPLEIQEEIAKSIGKMKSKIKKLQNQSKENRNLAIEEFEKEIFK